MIFALICSHASQTCETNRTFPHRDCRMITPFQAQSLIRIISTIAIMVATTNIITNRGITIIIRQSPSPSPTTS